MGKVRLALQPYGRKKKLRFWQCPIIGLGLKQHGRVEKDPRTGPEQFLEAVYTLSVANMVCRLAIALPEPRAA